MPKFLAVLTALLIAFSSPLALAREHGGEPDPLPIGRLVEEVRRDAGELANGIGDVAPRLPANGPTPLPYGFGVTIRQDQPHTVPYVSGTLMNGCKFSAKVDHGVVVCAPPIAPPANSYWFCSFSGLIASASAGTVHGRTHCKDEPVVTATSTYPVLTWNLQRNPLYLTNPVYQFAWSCIADFSQNGTGYVLCDEPDPPVQYWF